jgi:DNA-binding NtrC family response regulator
MPRKPSLSRSLVRWLESASAPIYLLDSQRRIVFGNAAFSRWVNRPAEDLAGVRCDYHTSVGVSGSIELAAALCPPPGAFSGELTSGSVAATTGEGKLDQRQARYVLLTASESSTGLLVIVDGGGDLTAEPNDSSQLAPQWLHAMLQRLRGEMGRRYHIGQLIGESDPLRRVREQVRIASEACPRVLIVGPPGSGREHVARTIHYSQPAASIGPLVPIDCALVDAEEMQAILTSLLKRQVEAPTQRPPAALLLQVDKLREAAQQELAGFLALPEVELHTLATARSSLSRLAARGRFRQELAYALSTLTIALPPLRSRAGDVPLLAQFFLEEFNAEGKRQLAGFAPQALDELVAYEWPENVAELAQVVREACERATGPQVLAGDLPDRIHLAANAVAHAAAEPQAIQLDDFLAAIEKELIERALRLAKGNKTKAADLLGVNRARLLRRLVQLGLGPPLPEDEAVVFEPLQGEPVREQPVREQP